MSTKCKRVEARVTFDEYELLKEKCKELNLNHSEYFRHSINGFIPDRNLMVKVMQIIFELKKIGVNINQVAKYANQTGIINEIVLRDLINDLNDVINDLSFNIMRTNYGCYESMENK